MFVGNIKAGDAKIVKGFNTHLFDVFEIKVRKLARHWNKASKLFTVVGRRSLKITQSDVVSLAEIEELEKEREDSRNVFPAKPQRLVEEIPSDKNDIHASELAFIAEVVEVSVEVSEDAPCRIALVTKVYVAYNEVTYFVSRRKFYLTGSC